MTVELHRDRACSTPIASLTLPLADLDRIVELKRFPLHGAPPAPRLAELRHVVTAVPAVAAVYARVVGDAVVPTGGACQVQALAPPPPVARPLARDANGTSIGVLSVIATQGQDFGLQAAVLRDDGYGLYGVAIGRSIFAALDTQLEFASDDCTGTPYLPRYGVLQPTAQLQFMGTVYGPAGPATAITTHSALIETGCGEFGPYDESLVPATALDLGRFVPPFRVDHAPPTP